MKNILAVILSIVLFIVGIAVFGTEQRQIDSHVHGEARLNIVMSGSTIHYELHLTGADIENSLGSDWDHKLDELSPEHFLGVKGTSVTFNDFAISVEDDDHEDEHEDEHEEDHEEDHDKEEHLEEVHYEITIQLIASVQKLSKLKQLNFPFFEVLASLDHVEVIFIDERRQLAKEIEDDSAFLKI